jgi:uncharacterized DUF497 family protein
VWQFKRTNEVDGRQRGDAVLLPSHQLVGALVFARTIVVVFIALGKETVSLISMRAARRNERKRYAEYPGGHR